MMPGQGSGPSRRSHTKSRKGCKTCKRRHIRCDETFPQCRNCTKHNVRCDYDAEGHPSPEQPVLTSAPEDHNELQQHLLSISNDLARNGTSIFTTLQKLPDFFNIASSSPYVLHALLAFSANHLSWAQGSTEARNLAILNGGVALRGLHEAINSFSRQNADGVLAASLLMLWQATDWRSWSSLRAGIQSILSSMHAWKHESIFSEYVAEEGLVASAFRAHQRQPSVNSLDRDAALQDLLQALQRLHVALAGQELELYWAGQLLSYVQNLHNLEAAKTPEEQFNQLYYLRKWLFWVPLSLFSSQRQSGRSPSILTLSYFYATALVLEPLFPDLGSSFCSALALPPLEATIRVMDATQAQCTNDDIARLMHYPRQAAINYRSSAARINHAVLQQPTPMVLSSDLWSSTVGNLSPAFAPSTPAGPARYMTTPQATSSSHSPWLEVPGAAPAPGFGYGTQNWGVPSPGFPSISPSHAEQIYEYTGISTVGGGWRGGSTMTDSTAATSHFQQEEGKE